MAFLRFLAFFVFSDLFTSVIVFGSLWRFLNISTWVSLFLVPLPTCQNLFKKNVGRASRCNFNWFKSPLTFCPNQRFMFSWIFELQNKDFLSRPIFRLSTYKKLSLFYIKNKINPVSLISMGDKMEKITHTVEPPASSVSRLTDGARETLIAAISGCDGKHCFRVSKRESTPHKKRKSKSNNRESWLQTYANCKGSHLNMSAVFEYPKTCMLCVKKTNFVRASQIRFLDFSYFLMCLPAWLFLEFYGGP